MSSHARHTPPAGVLAELREHAGHATAGEHLRSLGLRPMTGGRNNAVYEWASPDGPVCIKVYRVDERRRIHREWQSLILLAQHQITSAPAPLWIDPAPWQPAIGMSFLPGRSLPDLDDKNRPLRALATTLRRLTAVPLNDELRSLVRVDSADHYINRIRSIWAAQLASQPRDALTRDLLRILHRWADSGDADTLAGPAAQIFSRGDSNLVNWLWNGAEARCVDFEFAGWSDLPFECADLVEHISAREIGDPAWHAIIASIGLQDDGHEQRRFAAAQRTCALRWLAVLWKQREQRAGEFTTQLDRVRSLQRQAQAAT